MRFVLALLAIAIAACNQPLARDPIMTDCHDGTFCGPVYPECTGDSAHPCAAASSVPTAWGAQAAPDAGPQAAPQTARCVAPSDTPWCTPTEWGVVCHEPSPPSYCRVMTMTQLGPESWAFCCRVAIGP